MAETVLRHRANMAGPNARAEDTSATRLYAQIKQAVLKVNAALLNSYGGVTATLKRAIELQPVAEGRSLQVVIDFEFLLDQRGRHPDQGPAC